MTEHSMSCDHRWRYFVNVQSRAVRIRKCERCGTRDAVDTSYRPTVPSVAPAPAQPVTV